MRREFHSNTSSGHRDNVYTSSRGKMMPSLFRFQFTVEVSFIGTRKKMLQIDQEMLFVVFMCCPFFVQSFCPFSINFELPSCICFYNMYCHSFILYAFCPFVLFKYCFHEDSFTVGFPPKISFFLNTQESSFLSSAMHHI